MKRIKDMALGILTEIGYAVAIIAGGFLIGGIFYLVF